MLRYRIAPKCLLPGPFGHSDVGGNPGVAGRFVAIISFLHTPVSTGEGRRPVLIYSIPEERLHLG